MNISIQSIYCLKKELLLIFSLHFGYWDLFYSSLVQGYFDTKVKFMCMEPGHNNKISKYGVVVEHCHMEWFEKGKRNVSEHSQCRKVTMLWTLPY